MAITVNNEVAITNGLIGKVNGGTVTGNANFNGLYYNRAYNIDPIVNNLTFNLNTNSGNYFTSEITSGHPYIKYAATYVATATGSSTIALPAGVSIDDRIVVLVSSSTVNGLWAIDNQDFQYGMTFNKSSALGISSIFAAERYRKILIANHTTDDIFVLMIIKNPGTSASFSITSATGASGMPDPLAINAASTQNIEIAFARIAQTGFTPTAPTGMTMISWYASATHTFMAAYRNNVLNQSFDPPAFGGTGSAAWEARSTSILGNNSLSANPFISITGNGSCIFDFTYLNGTISWDTDILWANNSNSSPTFLPGTKHIIYFQKALNSKWLAVHYPQ